MHMQRFVFCFSFIFLAVIYNLLGQDYPQTRELIPATPTTAALGKYGEVPVSMHTGIPSITVPLAQLSGKDLSLGIELSYHAGGVKVEEMASWVGLNWSLIAGGVITRQIRSLPDEDQFGFFNKTVKNSQFAQNYLLNVQNSLNGMMDFEPDVFFFNFAGEAGKFMYNEQTEKFVTIDKSQNQIKYNSEKGWEIVSGNGTTYYFHDQEINVSNNSCLPSSSTTTVTGWYLTKIVNANRTDSIQFEYSRYGYSFQTIISADRIFIPYGSTECNAIGGSNIQPVCFRNNSFNALRLKKIIARSGKIEFRTSLVQRLDIQFDYGLEFIDIYGPSNTLLHSIKLIQDYFLADVSYLNRLRLKGIEKISPAPPNGGTAVVEKVRSFEYTSEDIPSRFSYAQDYWGYYNGQTSNSTLIPTVVVQTANGPLSVTGANRDPSDEELHSQVGMLKKIIYPTGGFTTFEYESHKVNSNYFPKTQYNSVQLDASMGSGLVYSVNFSLNYPPNLLNGNSVNGGAFVSIEIDGITCDYGQISGQASTGCAVISLTGPVGFTLTGNIADRYLPNGNYTLTFNFNTNTHGLSSWQDFYARVLWKELVSGSSTYGGLRIKKISSFDPLTNKIASQKSYEYHIESDANISSAANDKEPSFVRSVAFRKEEECPIAGCTAIVNYCNALKISATSNYPVSGLTDNVTYSFVTVLDGQNGENGKSTFEYSNTPDDVVETYPYQPANKNDWMRGQLLKQKDYVYKNQSYHLLREIKNVYTFHSENLPNIQGIKVFPLHNGIETVYLNSTGAGIWGPATLFTEGDYSTQAYLLNYGFRSTLDSTIVTEYDQFNPVLKFKSSERNYFNKDHLNLVRKEIVTSNGNIFVNRFKYLNDYLNIGTDDASLAISLMKTKNMVNTLIESSSWKKRTATDSTLISANLSVYSVENGKVFLKRALSHPNSAGFLESSIFANQFIFSSNYNEELNIGKYDDIGNIREAYGKEGVFLSFIWNTEKLNPIVALRGAKVDDVYYTSFEDTGVTHIDATTNQNLAKSGNKVLDAGTYSIPLSYNSQASNLKMSYWYWANNKWNFSGELPFTRNITSTGSKLDEIRVYPAGAQLTTYTYKLGVGVSSATDQNGITTNYEYDSFGRLEAIKDDQKNVVKSVQYKYQN